MIILEILIVILLVFLIYVVSDAVRNTRKSQKHVAAGRAAHKTKMRDEAKIMRKALNTIACDSECKTKEQMADIAGITLQTIDKMRELENTKLK